VGCRMMRLVATSLAALLMPASVGPPPIVQRFIPFGAKRKHEMTAYAERHYGLRTYKLVHPRVIVEHYTETTTFSSAYNTFAQDVPDSELHELPGTCAHFIVDRDGTIYQLVHLGIMCRHTVGLNYTAFGIEHVGMSDADVMGDRRELQSSLRLTRWLRCRYGIAVKNVIGHNESLSSPYHHERVARLRTQTHGDMRHATMQTYRSRLARIGCG
jgi:N-acetylmuramoyl-L-alanine amidase